MGIAVLVLGLAAGAAEAKGKRGAGRPRAARYDPSLDFSKHFDDEVKADRARAERRERSERRHQPEPRRDDAPQTNE